MRIQKWYQIFFRLFNEALAKHVGNENYKFNPSMICTDEAGAILQAICNVFGEEYLELNSFLSVAFQAVCP